MQMAGLFGVLGRFAAGENVAERNVAERNVAGEEVVVPEEFPSGCPTDLSASASHSRSPLAS